MPARLSVYVPLAVTSVVVDGATTTVNVRSEVAIGEDPVAVMVKEYDPAVAGVPVRAPADDKDRPVGRLDPFFTAYDTAFVAARVIAAMAVPAVRPARVAEVVHDGVVATSCVNVLSATAMDDVPVAVTVKL